MLMWHTLLPDREQTQDRTPPPKVLSQAVSRPGTVQVEVALPNLRRASLSVPEHRWREGGHLGALAGLSRELARLDVQAAAIAGRLPDQGQSAATARLQEARANEQR